MRSARLRLVAITLGVLLLWSVTNTTHRVHVLQRVFQHHEKAEARLLSTMIPIMVEAALQAPPGGFVNMDVDGLPLTATMNPRGEAASADHRSWHFDTNQPEPAHDDSLRAGPANSTSEIGSATPGSDMIASD